MAITDPGNQASARVLEATGLRFERLLPAGATSATAKALRLFARDA